MSINNVFGIAGSAMNAQMVRMNASASNMANSSTTAGTQETAYKAKRQFSKQSLPSNKLLWDHLLLVVSK